MDLEGNLKTILQETRAGGLPVGGAWKGESQGWSINAQESRYGWTDVGRVSLERRGDARDIDLVRKAST